MTNRPTGERIDELVNEYPFEAIIQAVQGARQPHNRKKLTEALQRILWDPRFETTEEHHALAAISFWGARPTLTRLFTTNFDIVLEKLFGERGVRITEANANSVRAVERVGKLPIIYLHGQLDGDYQISEWDIFDQTHSVLRNEFHAALLGSSAFIFVGYSMSDPDFRRVYMQFQQDILTRPDRGKKTYVVMPANDEASYLLGGTIWKERNAIWIPLDAANFFKKVKQTLEIRISVDVRARIMKKYGIGGDDLASFDDLVQRTADILRIAPNEAIRFLDDVRGRIGDPS